MNEIINVNRRGIIRQTTTTDDYEFLTLKGVLVCDLNLKLFAVYEGIGSDEFVKRYGNKLTYREALRHFPMLEEKKYRK